MHSLCLSLSHPHAHSLTHKTQNSGSMRPVSNALSKLSALSRGLTSVAASSRLAIAHPQASRRDLRDLSDLGASCPNLLGTSI